MTSNSLRLAIFYNQVLEIELEQNKQRSQKLENTKDRRIEELENDMRIIKEFAKSIRKESS